MTDDIGFLETVMGLKDEKRTGWEERGIVYPESVAAHTFGTAFLAWVLGDGDERAVKMALAHDIHEAVSGDIPSGGLDEEEQTAKKSDEEDAFAELVSTSPFDLEEMAELWEEYESRETETARFVKDMDLLDMVLQAYIYEKQERYQDDERFRQTHGSLDEFFEHAQDRLHTEMSRDLFDRIRDRYTEEQG